MTDTTKKTPIATDGYNVIYDIIYDIDDRILTSLTDQYLLIRYDENDQAFFEYDQQIYFINDFIKINF